MGNISLIRNEDGFFTVSAIAELMGGSLKAVGVSVDPTASVGEVRIDSRTVETGDLFVALQGERTDGERYISDAFARGAIAVLCKTGGSKRCGYTGVYVEVSDPLSALISAAAKLRRESGVRIIGVTGSVGKTTVKELCIKVLSERYPTDGTRGNYNNILGLSLSVLNAFSPRKYGEIRGKFLKNAQKYLVLEMGISRIGEMAELARIAAPDIAVITNIGSMHGEFLGGREGIASEKSQIASLGVEMVICPHDPVLMDQLLKTVDKVRIVSLSTDGVDGGDSCLGNTLLRFLGEKNGFGDFDLAFTDGNGKRVVSSGFTAPIIGRHGVYDSALAALVGICSDVGDFEIRRGLAKYVAPSMRQEIIVCGEVIRIADCYNSGPESVRASLSAMEEYSRLHRCKRRIAVLGSMLELGEGSSEEHFKLGTELNRFGVDLLFAIGDEARMIAEGAKANGMDADRIFCFTSGACSEEIKALIESRIVSGDIILYKGSRGMELEKLL